jgi:hypothetical protein
MDIYPLPSLDTVLIRVGPSRARTGRPMHLDMYSSINTQVAGFQKIATNK